MDSWMPKLQKKCGATVIARTGERFSDFAPYVPAMGEDGRVAFQAAVRSGGTGVFMGDGKSVTSVLESGEAGLGEVCSHPDVGGGPVCFYVVTRTGERGLVLWRDGSVRVIAERIGPLGPSINARGDVAFRVHDGGASSLRVWREGTISTLAESSEEIAGFQGVPVVNGSGDLTFCAELRSGGKGVFVSRADAASGAVCIAREGGSAGEQFRSLGSFPMINDAGTVAFCATLERGRAGVFTARNSVIRCVRQTGDEFESIRGVLIDGAGRIVMIATPAGGTLAGKLGIFREHEHVLSIGSDLCGSIVSDFALNGVSINSAGQLAIRVAFDDGGQAIVRV